MFSNHRAWGRLLDFVWSRGGKHRAGFKANESVATLSSALGWLRNFRLAQLHRAGTDSRGRSN